MKITYYHNAYAQQDLGEASTFAEADALITAALTGEKNYPLGPILSSLDWNVSDAKTELACSNVNEFGDDSRIIISDISEAQMNEWFSSDYEDEEDRDANLCDEVNTIVMPPPGYDPDPSEILDSKIR